MTNGQSTKTPQRPRQSVATSSAQTKEEPATRHPTSLTSIPTPQELTRDDRPYLKLAFANPYNLSLLIGSLSISLLTVNPILAVLTLGVESLWLLHAPDSARLRRILWDPYFDKVRDQLAAAGRAERLALLESEARNRVVSLIARQTDIHRLAAQNPSFAGDLLRNELGKTDRLVNAFLDMSLTCQRYSEYLDQVNTQQLDRDKQRYGQIANASQPNDPEAQIAQKNIAVTDKRIAKLAEIKRYLQVARGQLDLIENSFQLLVEQIVTMQSPQELSGQLDELLDGVESIRQTTQETEQLVGGLDHDE